jgi:hypothetical protein
MVEQEREEESKRGIGCGKVESKTACESKKSKGVPGGGREGALFTKGIMKGFVSGNGDFVGVSKR